MERTDLLELMATLKLYGMRAAYDEVMTTGIKRRHEPPRILGDLLSAEIAEKQARSIKYQLTIAKLPLAKDIQDFDFTGTPVNEALIRDLASGVFLAEQRNAVLIGGTGTGKSHLAIVLRGPASAAAPGAASIPSSISSIGWRVKPAPAGRGGSPNISREWTSSFSTNSATCPLLRPEASCSFISSAGYTSALPSSSPPIWPLAIGLACLASRRPHDASFFERVVRRTCVLNSTICVFERLICQGIPLVIWWPDNRPF